MKKVTIILTGVILMTIGTLNVNAQGSSATATSNATAKIMTPIALNNSQALVFGNIAASTTAGTVTVAPAGTRTSAGGVTPSVIGAFNNAIFTATGESAATYAISLPANGTVTISNGTQTMNVNNFVSDPIGTGLLTGGSQVINVGATLSVGANQSTGTYTGTYSVTVAYN